MKELHLIGTVILLSLVSSCGKKGNRKDSASNAGNGMSHEQSPAQNAARPDGVVEMSVINEENIDAFLPVGMNRVDVEKILGKAFSYEEEDVTVTASYFINREYTEKVELVSFSIVYRSGKISGVRKSWFGEIEE